MPKLPKLKPERKTPEADITPKVLKWFEKHYKHSCALEIKTTKGRLKPHQKVALEKVSKGTYSYKIPDKGVRNPFDAVVLQGADAFVVVCDVKAKFCTVKDPATNAVQFNFKV